MVCYHPLIAYQSRTKGANGKSEIIFNKQKARDHSEINLPCGQCSGCRGKRAGEWAVRCTHEASLYKENCFITLTYSPQWLPEDGSLSVRDWQLFMKKLRKKYGDGIRFFHCGEYGEKLGRPHYHAILFNFDFSDKTVWKKTKQGHTVWRSKSLEELWPWGMSEIGSVTYESACYVARYIHKKITGDAAMDHYMRVDPATGQIFNLKPEYITMSRRPGIAYEWFQKYHTDVYPHDEVILKGRKIQPPRYYDRQYEILDHNVIDDVKHNRYISAIKHIDDNTPERLAVKELVTLAKLKSLKRQLEQ